MGGQLYDAKFQKKEPAGLQEIAEEFFVNLPGYEGLIMGKGFILWLLGVPFSLLLVLWIFGFLR